MGKWRSITPKKMGIAFRWFKNVFSLILLFLIIVGVVGVKNIKESTYRAVNDYLDRRAEIAVKFFKSYFLSSYNDFYSTANILIKEFDDIKNAEVQIFDSNGEVVISTSGLSVPVKLTFTGIEREQKAYRNPGTGESVMSMTVALKDNIGTSHGAVRFIVSLSELNIRQFLSSVLLIAALISVVILVFLSGLFYIRSIVIPVNVITESAQRIAKGDFSIRIKKEHDDEIGGLSDAINNMAMELSKIDQLKNDFLSSVSHELRTPLTAIRGWSETVMICDPDTDKEMMEKGMNIISAETERLAYMVEELLDYSKIQSGKFTINKIKINIFKLISETIDIYNQRAKQSQNGIILEEPNFSTETKGDPNRLKQVFINILDNALKHSMPGGNIEVFFIEDEKYIGVVFRDHGSGINAEDLKHVKKRFYKGKSQKPGSGLGLAISDEVVKMHGGNLLIESKEKIGTNVTISIPKIIDE